MCTTVEEQIIRKVTKQFIEESRLFTSVDIANAIKKSGTWIRNREVAQYLRNNMFSLAGLSYTQTLIPVTLEDGSMTEAYLYHPFDVDSIDYTDTNQRVLNPSEVGNNNKTAEIHIHAVPDALPSFNLDALKISDAVR